MIGDRPKERRDGDLALILGEISGAPGDGDAALRRAIQVLRRTEVAIASQMEKLGPRLDAQIEVTSHSDKQDQVRLVWTIRDSEQKTVAVLKQENVLPKGRIDRKWGSLAFDIALAVRPQIVESVRRFRDPQPHGLAVPRCSAEVRTLRFCGAVYRKICPCYRDLGRRQVAAGRRSK